MTKREEEGGRREGSCVKGNHVLLKDQFLYHEGLKVKECGEVMRRTGRMNVWIFTEYTVSTVDIGVTSMY